MKAQEKLERLERLEKAVSNSTDSINIQREAAYIENAENSRAWAIVLKLFIVGSVLLYLWHQS